jgi:hypothetical protein
LKGVEPPTSARPSKTQGVPPDAYGELSWDGRANAKRKQALVDFGVHVGLFLLIFLTVSLGIAAGWEVVSGLLFRDADRVRHRLAMEFGKEQ